MTNTFATSENPFTNPDFSPQDRAHQAMNATVSCDWNPETEQFNPYPLGSSDFREYERTLEGLTLYGWENGYDL